MTILLFLALQDPLQPVKIPLPEAARHGVTWSPDGKWVYYFEDVAKTDKFSRFARNAALYRCTPDGKTVEKLLEAGNVVGQVHWHPDGKRMLLVRCVDDTTSDGKVDRADGDSLWIGDWDGKNGKDLIPAQKKKLSLYGILAEDKLILGYRDDFAKPAKIVTRAADGKEEDLVEAWAYLAGDWIKSAEMHDGHEDKASWKTKDGKTTLESDRVVGSPVFAPGRIWYARRVDSNKDNHFDHKDNTVLVLADADAKNARDITKGDELIIPVAAIRGGVLCVVRKGEDTSIEAVRPRGARLQLYASKAPCRDVRFSPDGTSLAFVAKDEVFLSPFSVRPPDPKVLEDAMAAARKQASESKYGDALGTLQLVDADLLEEAQGKQLAGAIAEVREAASKKWEELKAQVAELEKAGKKADAAQLLKAAEPGFEGVDGVIEALRARLAEIQK